MTPYLRNLFEVFTANAHDKNNDVTLADLIRDHVEVVETFTCKITGQARFVPRDVDRKVFDAIESHARWTGDGGAIDGKCFVGGPGNRKTRRPIGSIYTNPVGERAGTRFNGAVKYRSKDYTCYEWSNVNCANLDMVRAAGIRRQGASALLYLTTGLVLPKGLILDHVDGDGTNNSTNNIRALTHAANMAAVNAAQGLPYSACKGVNWHIRDGQWIVVLWAPRSLGFDGRQYTIGYFERERQAEAEAAYMAAERAMLDHGILPALKRQKKSRTTASHTYQESPVV